VIMSWRNWFSERWQCSDKRHDMGDEKFSSFKLLIQHVLQFLKVIVAWNASVFIPAIKLSTNPAIKLVRSS
jgi:hypothetical protein